MAELYPRLRSSLHTPDAADWQRRRHYIPELAGALRYAYLLLQVGSTNAEASFLSAYAALIPFRTLEMCAEQRLRLEYALALAYAGENAISQALDAVERALDVTDDLSDEVAPIELGYLAGALSHAVNEQEQAYDLYRIALDALQALARDGVVADPMLELDLSVRLGWRAWELGQVSQSRQHLNEAYSLRAQWPSSTPALAASLSWLDAQLALAQEDPARAVEMALPAAMLLLDEGQTLNAGRALTFLAECATALAQTPEVDDPQAALDLARDAARRAHDLARLAHDKPGGQIARLASLQVARVEALRIADNTGATALSTLEHVLRIANRLDDIALVGRAETALGDEFRAAGDDDMARVLYTRATWRLEEHGLGGLAHRPRRALRRMNGR